MASVCTNDHVARSTVCAQAHETDAELEQLKKEFENRLADKI